MAQTNANTSATATTNPRDSKITMDDISPALPKNVAHLLREPVEIDCPACRQHNITRVDPQIVTCLQRVAAIINGLSCCCYPLIKWKGRYDYNHYCSQCGCYIGRYMTPNWYKRYMLLSQRDAVTSPDSCCYVPPKSKNNKREPQPTVPEPIASNTPYAPTTMPIRK